MKGNSREAAPIYHMCGHPPTVCYSQTLTVLIPRMQTLIKGNLDSLTGYGHRVSGDRASSGVTLVRSGVTFEMAVMVVHAPLRVRYSTHLSRMSTGVEVVGAHILGD